MNLFKYTFTAQGTEQHGLVDLDKTAHIDFFKREFPGEEGSITREAVLLTFPWQVQKQVPDPVYDTPSKEQKVSGQMPHIKSWRNTVMWVNYTVTVEKPEEVEQLKQLYKNNL